MSDSCAYFSPARPKALSFLAPFLHCFDLLHYAVAGVHSVLGGIDPIPIRGVRRVLSFSGPDFVVAVFIFVAGGGFFLKDSVVSHRLANQVVTHLCPALYNQAIPHEAIAQGLDHSPAFLTEPRIACVLVDFHQPVFIEKIPKILGNIMNAGGVTERDFDAPGAAPFALISGEVLDVSCR